MNVITRDYPQRYCGMPLRKACDICKFRKVKCEGGTPCQACQRHGKACMYSRSTRKQLLQQASAELEFSGTMHRGPELEKIADSSFERCAWTTTANSLTCVGSGAVAQASRQESRLCQSHSVSFHGWHSTQSLSTFQPASAGISFEEIPLEGDLSLGLTSLDWSLPVGIRNVVMPEYMLTESCPKASSLASPSGLIQVYHLQADGFGNSALLLSGNSAQSRDNRVYWGPTSYVGLQDVLSRMLQVKTAVNHATCDDLPFPLKRGAVALHRDQDIRRWGCADYIFREDSDTQSIPGLSNLSSSLARRFLRRYIDSVHPLFPLLDPNVLSEIALAYDAPRHLPLSPTTISDSPLDRARITLILALGAQMVAHDEDVDCPRNIALIWSASLQRQALDFMQRADGSSSQIEMIELWILYAAINRTCGRIEEQLQATAAAGRLITLMGVHRPCRHDPVQYRSYLMSVSFYFEKWACLCHGVPTTVTWTPLSPHDSQLADPKRSFPVLQHLIGLAQLMDDVQELYNGMNGSSNQASLNSILEVYNQILEFRRSLPRDYIAFETTESSLAVTLHEHGVHAVSLQATICGLYLQLKILVLLPLLEHATWLALRNSAITSSSDLERLTSECVEAAVTTVRLFERHTELCTWSPEMSLSCVFLLYAICVIYMANLRHFGLRSQHEFTPLIRLALRALERYHHPAATVAEAMCQDLLANSTGPDAGYAVG